jgi:hypothetical protein
MFRTDPAPFLARLGQVVVRPVDEPDGTLRADASALAFVRFATACPPPQAWTGRQRLRGALVPSGTLIATFDRQGGYGCADGSAHTGLLLAVIAPDLRGPDWIAHVGFLDVLEQMRHPVGGQVVQAPAASRPAWLGPPRPPVPHAPLVRRRVPFLGGDLRRAGAGAQLCDDADQYCVVEMARHLDG